MNKFNSIFGQILQLFPRTQFKIFVKETGAAKATKGFSCCQPQARGGDKLHPYSSILINS
jgi:hypothetical protein